MAKSYSGSTYLFKNKDTRKNLQNPALNSLNHRRAWLHKQLRYMPKLPPNNTEDILSAWCNTSNDIFSVKIFRKFNTQIRMKVVASCVAGVWKGRERGFWARENRGRARREGWKLSLPPRAPLAFLFRLKLPSLPFQTPTTQAMMVADIWAMVIILKILGAAWLYT